MSSANNNTAAALAAAGSGTGNASDKKAAAAFDFDVDFEKVQKRREQYLAKKAAERGETAGLGGIDEQDGVDGSNQQGGFAAGGGGPGGQAGKGFGRFNPFARQSMMATGSSAGASAMQAAAAAAAGAMNDNNDQAEKEEEILYGGKRVTQWPYDDYHAVQQMYYVRVDELSKQNFHQEEKTAAETAAASATNLQRPPDPPDVPTAVMGLPLSNFESKAEERAIAIVSTWLFDCGLIDELLVHGGMAGGSTKIVSVIEPDGGGAGGTADPTGSDGQTTTTTEINIDGPSKMDQELTKLKASSQRTLALINARLNDGVAASGAEVQELVNAVNSTKDDLAKLRELSTYIASTGDVEQRSQTFMLTRYPKLKKAINARRNLARCFRELDFYAKIPLTCDRLRDELHSAEWTDNEWNSLRDVCREHVDLEIFLVEAEAGMKKRIDEETHDQAGVSTGPGGRSNYLSSKMTMHNHEEVDNFLHEHVKNVWELGDEIRVRIMSGIGSAFDLAMNNPAGMVALVEAVEVYETANEEYKTVHGEEAGSNQTLRFTDMRASALKQIYQDFEMRGLEVFREVQEMAEHQAAGSEGEDTENAVFSAVLRVCNHLTSEIVFVQNQMSPCFPPYWALETLWSTCVAYVCSKQILDRIGGTEGHKLPDLTVTQLLDLVAWVEHFRETIEESFPNIGEHTSKKEYFNERPDLLMDNNKQVDMDVARDSLAWANNMLWQVHDLAKDEFLYRTKLQTDEWLDNVYIADHTKSQTSEGRLITSLCEDVYSLAGVQLRTIRERLTRRSEALVQAVGVIFKNLYQKQVESRNNFCQDFETCCAASNDFFRMSEKCEEILQEMIAECNLSPEASEALDEQSAILLGLYSSDAVFAAQKVHIYVFEPIEDAIVEELFGQEWLNELSHNELALTLVRTLEDFMGDLEAYLDDLMVGKSLDALITSTVNFYITSLMRVSTKHNNNKKPYWSDNRKALDRIKGDITVMKEYFEQLAPSYPALTRVIESEFEALDTVHELLAIASGFSHSTDRDFVIVMQKRIKNIYLTKMLVGDLWHLAKPTDEKAIYDMIDSMMEELEAVAPDDKDAITNALARQTVPGLRLDQEIAKVVEEGRTLRGRPGIKKAVGDQAEVMLNKWKKTWNTLVEEAE